MQNSCNAVIILLLLNLRMFSSHIFKDIVIQQDDEIRLKIVGTRVDKNDIVSVFFSFLFLKIRTIYFT